MSSVGSVPHPGKGLGGGGRFEKISPSVYAGSASAPRSFESAASSQLPSRNWRERTPEQYPEQDPPQQLESRSKPKHGTGDPLAPGADVTQLLTSVRRGEEGALDALLPLVYDELRGLAGRHLQSERRDHTLQATALAHEAYLRLVVQRNQRWQDRAHFFAVASLAIRRILVDHARSKGALRRGGDRARQEFHDDITSSAPSTPDLDLVALDEALTALTVDDARKARGVELRFFGGLTAEEIAEVQGISVATVERDWSFARAWLHRQIEGKGT